MKFDAGRPWPKFFNLFWAFRDLDGKVYIGASYWFFYWEVSF